MIKNIQLHNFGNFKLDGGAMFGPVPKSIWQKLIRPDENNLIPMASNTLIIEGDWQSHYHKIVIDHGMSNYYPDKITKRYAIEKVKEIDLPETVTDWVLTHLHFDHIGELHHGRSKNPYPQAAIHLQKNQLATAKNPSIKELNGFTDLDINFLEKQQLNLLSGETELLPGIKLKISNGHTTGLQYLELETQEGLILFPGDLIPTIHHVNFFYHMGYDLNPETLLQEKLDLLEYASKVQATVVFQHEAFQPIAKIKKTGEYKFEAIPEETI